MRLFLEVARYGSFSAVSRMLGISTSSVSRRIDTLESSLGVHLLNRNSRKLTLTNAGQVYRDQSLRIMNGINQLNDEISDLHGQPKGVIHIHTRLQIGVDLIAPPLPRFLAKYPEIKVKLWLDEETRDIIENEIDIAIRIGNITEPSLTVKKLFDGTERVLTASPEYFRKNPVIRHPEDLASHNCMTWDVNGRTLYDYQAWEFMRDDDKIKVNVTGNIFVNNASILKRCAIQGLGIALLPRWVVEKEIESGELTVILSDWKGTSTVFDHKIYAVFYRTLYMPKRIRLFLDFYEDYFKSITDIKMIGSDVT